MGIKSTDHSRRAFLGYGAATAAALGWPSRAGAADSPGIADQIFHGGDILTMEGATPAYAEALAVRDGKIAFVGKLRDAESLRGSATRMVDLRGGTLLPGFIDPHSHVAMGAAQVDWANLYAAPMGTVDSIAALVAALRGSQRDLAPGSWVLGLGYDPDLLAERRHPTAADLDAAFPDVPVYAMHVSGHMGVANTAAMRARGISAATADPPGGTIVRKPGTREPEGLFQENAQVFFMDQLQPRSSEEVAAQRLSKALSRYASLGITTAQDGGVMQVQMPLLRYAAARGMLPIDLIVLPFYRFAENLMADRGLRWGVYDNRLKLGGIKLTVDGSPQGKTAYLTKPYLTPVPGCSEDCTGAPVLSQEALEFSCRRAYEAGIQVFSHCNGDGAIDMMIRAHGNALQAIGQSAGSHAKRTVIIHSQVMRIEQVDAYAQLGLIPAFFTNHTFFWGDTHVANLGRDRADMTSPMRAAIDRGIRPTTHSDFPVTLPDPLFTVWSAVNRVSRSGSVIGPGQRVSAYEALQATTINVAHQYFEEGQKGSLVAGKLADLVILDRNPLKVPPAQIKDIAVLRTLKEGKDVFARDAREAG